MRPQCGVPFSHSYLFSGLFSVPSSFHACDVSKLTIQCVNNTYSNIVSCLLNDFMQDPQFEWSVALWICFTYSEECYIYVQERGTCRLLMVGQVGGSCECWTATRPLALYLSRRRELFQSKYKSSPVQVGIWSGLKSILNNYITVHINIFQHVT